MLKEDIDNIKKDEVLICNRCRRRIMNILTKHEVMYKKRSGLPYCQYCKSSFKLQKFTSKEALIKDIDHKIEILSKHQPIGYKKTIKELLIFKGRLI